MRQSQARIGRLGCTFSFLYPENLRVFATPARSGLRTSVPSSPAKEHVGEPKELAEQRVRVCPGEELGPVHGAVTIGVRLP